MKSNVYFRKIALSFKDVQELPHFEKTSFRIHKKIFATLQEETQLACVKLSLIDQSVFCAMDPGAISAVKNKWGLQGWTYIDLHNVDKKILKDITKCAYQTVLNK